jgi:16S rRNA G966 N2-methylase RsmD
MLPSISGSVYVDTQYKYKSLLEDYFYVQQDARISPSFITDVSYTYKKQNNFIENISASQIFNDTNKIENPLNAPLEINVSQDFSKRIFGDSLQYRFSDVSLFSTTPYDQSIYTVELIKQFVDTSQKTILDSSACIGGNTIQFCKNFKKVFAVELYRKHTELMKHNLKVKNINNCEVINDNILNVDMNTDIIFYDPPWENLQDGDYYYESGNKKVFLKNLVENHKEKEIIILKVENAYDTIIDIGKKVYTYNIYDNNKIPIYKILIFTNLNQNTIIQEKTFTRLRYKEEQKFELNYREFANIIKNNLISKYIQPDAIVADIGSGKGGDLIKYANTKMRFAYLFEPYFYNDLLKRYKNMPQKDKFKLINSSGEGLDPTKVKKVDNVFMFFSLNFFTGSKLDALLYNIKNIIKTRGKVVFTYMDGNRTKDLLNKNNGVWSQCNYKIEGKGNDNIKIYIDAETVSMEGQYEYLMYHDFLVKKMNENGFKLIETKTFDKEYEYQKLDDEQDKIFTSLYRFDVYEKI